MTPWVHMLVGAGILILGYLGRNLLDKLFKRDCTDCKPIAQVNASITEIKEDVKEGFRTVHTRIDDLFFKGCD